MIESCSFPGLRQEVKTARGAGREKDGEGRVRNLQACFPQVVVRLQAEHAVRIPGTQLRTAAAKQRAECISPAA